MCRLLFRDGYTVVFVTEAAHAFLSDVKNALVRAGVVNVSDTNLTRAMYATDASIYRVPPMVVAFPRTVEELATCVAICASKGISLTVRGAGTSVAGNAIGDGLVVDLSRHMNRILEIDPARGIARVEPGVVQSDLQQACAPSGLRFGPDPSTATRCTIGGMIGNNACGSRALGYGKTSDNVVSIDVLLADGSRARFGQPSELDMHGAHIANQLAELGEKHAHVLRREFGTFGRQISGYALEHLLPEQKCDVRKLLVGSEGTLAIVHEATVRLVPMPVHSMLIAVGFSNMAEAADHVPITLRYSPTAVEGLDARLVTAVRKRLGDGRVPMLPPGNGWLLIELTSEDEAELAERASSLASEFDARFVMKVRDPDVAASIWQIRVDGAGLASRSPDGRPAYAGWEDAAVPPERLGSYLREFEQLLTEHALQAMPFGHFGDGCIHVRLDFSLDKSGGAQHMRTFLIEAAKLVARHGGSLSGEHGDGRMRSALLGEMYSPEALALFDDVKRVFDPDHLLNPGIIVNAPDVTTNLRRDQAKRPKGKLAHAFLEDGGDFVETAHRCTGVGKCRADNTTRSGAMCPSFLATREEKDSTRGRARVLQEMLNGDLVSQGWRSKELQEVLDYCLSCKSCASECPAGVDMAMVKSEALYHMYRFRLRPRSHYALGWLPQWAKFASRFAKVINAAMGIKPIANTGKKLGGIDERRSIPRFADTTFRNWFSKHKSPNNADKSIILWVDTFVEYFSPEVGIAAVAVLEAAGYRVLVTDAQECCGLTWITTGQLGIAKRKLQSALRALEPLLIDPQTLIVGIEPSCTAVLRHDVLELVGGELARRVARSTRTLAEVLNATPGWTPPDLSDVQLVAQPHCHHNAVMGWEEDEALLTQAGAQVKRLGNCCGLAGNFGVEQGHYDLSVAVAEHDLLPATRAMSEGEVLLADGFSCRTQLEDLSERAGQHLAQLLADRL